MRSWDTGRSGTGWHMFGWNTFGVLFMDPAIARQVLFHAEKETTMTVSGGHAP